MTERKQMEHAARNSERKYRTLFEKIPQGIYQTSLEGKLMAANPALVQLLGYESEKELLAANVEHGIYVKPEDRKTWMERIRTQGEVRDAEIVLKCKDGKELTVLDNAHVGQYEHGNPVYYEGTLTDITERKHAEKALRESEQRFRRITDNMLDVIAQTDLLGTCEYASPSMKTVLGYDPKDMLGKSMFEHVHPDDFDNVFEIVRKALVADRTETFEYRYRHADGHYVWLESRGNPIFDEKGQMIGAVLSSSDITERKRIESALQERAKELGCLYGIAQSIERLGSNLDVIMSDVVSIIPPAYLYPDIACARIVLGSQMFESAGFKESRWSQSADIRVLGNIAGRVEVYYLEEKPGSFEGPFQKEERALIDAVGERLGRVVERKRVQDELRESEDRLRRITENMLDMVVETDLQGICKYVSQSHKAVLGYDSEDLLGKSLFDFIHTEDIGIVMETVQRAISTDRLWTGGMFECRFRHADGHYVWLEVLANIVRDEKGQMIGGVLSSRDITERKQMEEELRLSESKYRSLVESATDLIFLVGKKDEIISANSAAARLLGRTVEEVLGKSLFDVYPKEMAAMFSENVREVLKTGKSRIIDEKIVFGGNEIWISTRLEPVLDDRGVVYAVMGVARDITERKRSEVELQKLASVVRYSSEFISLATLDGKITFLNEAGAKMLGIDPEEGQQVNIMQVIPDHLQEKVKTELLPALMMGGTWEGDLQYRNLKTSQLTDVHAITFTVKDPAMGKPLYLANVSLDITERKRADEKLRESEERFRGIAERSFDVIFTTDLEGNITYISPAVESTLGYKPEEVVGQPLQNYLPESEIPKAFETLSDALQGRAQKHTDFQVRRKDGSLASTEINASSIVKEGAVAGGLAILRDITERKQVERMKDQFVSTVSHELRTPLTSIRASLGLLASGVIGALPEKGQRMLDIAVNNTDRLVRLINDILDSERLASGKTPMEKRMCSAAQLVTQAVDVMKPMAEKAGIVLSVQSQNAALLADPDRISQALTNLISNAIKFSPKSGRIWVTAERKENQMLFKVQDEGRGIPPDKLGMLFERFQQVDASDAREKGGTGLGLSISRSIVEQHSGRIWVESKVGNGSTFLFTLPLPQETEVPAQPEAMTEAQGARVVLIIEDDPDLANILATMLQRHGIQPHIAHTAGKGIALSKQMHPDMIVLDLGLPDMDGSAVVQALREDNTLRLVPLVVYTVRELDNQQRENLRLGETLFFTKSRIRPDQFEEKVVQFMKRILENRGKTNVS